MMTNKQKNTVSLIAIVAGVISIPFTWLTIYSVRIPLLEQMARISGKNIIGTRIDITGFDGQFAFPFETPIWFIVCLAAGASLLQIARESDHFAIPKVVVLGTAITGTFLASKVAIGPFFDAQVSIGFGWVLGMFCTLVPVARLLEFSKRPNLKEVDSVMETGLNSNAGLGIS